MAELHVRSALLNWQLVATLGGELFMLLHVKPSALVCGE